MVVGRNGRPDRKSTRLNSSHTVIYTLSLHDALPISASASGRAVIFPAIASIPRAWLLIPCRHGRWTKRKTRSEEHTSELQSHSDLHSFPTRRSSDLGLCIWPSCNFSCDRFNSASMAFNTVSPWSLDETED